MPTTTLMPLPKQQFLTNTGAPLIGGKVYTFAAGTSTPKATYADSDGTIEQENPIMLNLRGEPQSPIYWSGNYRVEVRNALGGLIYTVDDFNTDPAGVWGNIVSVLGQFAAAAGASLIGFLQAGAGAVVRTVQDRLRESASVKDFGAKGDGITDDTAALLAAKAWAIQNLPSTLRVPKGTYLYTDLGNWAYTGLTLTGESHRSTVFKRTTNGPAFLADAFQPGFTSNDATAQFANAMNVREITFEGTATTEVIVFVQGLARCAWDGVFARTGKSADGLAFHFRGFMLSTFYNIGCSTDLDKNMASIPYEGLRMEAGSRNGSSVGNSSNNTFVNAYFEGLSIGIRLGGADENTFISGSSEGNSIYDVLVGPGSRYNTFLGMGFESPGSVANVSDAGDYTRYHNCYSNKLMRLQGRGAEISGGFFHKIEVQAGAIKNRVKDVTLSHWDNLYPGTGGFFYDESTQTEWKNLYDEIAAAYIYPLASRTGVPVNASPTTWTNNTGGYGEVIIQGGTTTQVRILRGADAWLNPTTTPSKHLLAPSDKIEVSYSVAPQMSFVPYNGFPG